MKFRNILLLIFLFVIYFTVRLKINYPVTEKEAMETYSAYTILLAGKDPDGNSASLFPTAGGQYLSPLSVYIRTVSIRTFGLNILGVRVGPIFLGFLVTLFFWLILREFIHNEKKAVLITILLSLSPLFVRYSIFKIDQVAALFISFVSIYAKLKSKRNLLFASLIIAIVFLPMALPFVITVILYEDVVKRRYGSVLLKTAVIFIGILLMVKSHAPYIGYFRTYSIFGSLDPSGYSYIIDKRLSFGKILDSSLIIGDLNLNRAVHNKLFYLTNEIFKLPVQIVDPERLSSSFQSSTILRNENALSLEPPSIFYWEWLIIIPGLYLLLKRNNPIYNMFFLGGVITGIFLKSFSITILPVMIISEIELIELLTKKSFYGIYVSVLAIVLYILSYFSFLDIFVNHSNVWIGSNDRVQEWVWTELEPTLAETNKIKVTDRLGEPAYYYLYYHKIQPDYFFSNTKTSVLDSGYIRVNSVGNVSFSSFNYPDEAKNASSIWVGSVGEFAGKNVDLSGFEKLKEGEIISKIGNVEIPDKLMGDKIWIVKI